MEQMENKYTPEQEPKKSGGSRQVVLLILLLVVAAGGYVYYFTGIFHQPPEPAKAPTAPEAQVKKPLPPREAVPVEPPAGEVKVAEQKVEPTAPAATPQPEAKVAKPVEEKPAKAEKPAAKQEAKPAAKQEVKPVKKAEPVKEAPAAKAEPKKQPAKNEVQQPTKAVKPAVAGKEAKPAAQEKAKPAAASKEKPAKPAKKIEPVVESAGTGEFTLVIGTYVVPSSMDADKEKVKKAGLTPVIVKGPKKAEPMIRILLSEAADRAGAEAELAKVKQVTEDAFILDEGGKYRVYGGSYFVQGRAESERQRLVKQGLRATLKKATVSVATLQLRAGKFPSRDAAAKEAERLKKLGLKTVVAPVKP